MKCPETDAEWKSLIEEDDRALAAARSEAEWGEILGRQMARDQQWDDGTRYDAYEVLDEIERELDERCADQARGTGATGAPSPAVETPRVPGNEGVRRPKDATAPR